LAKVFLRAKPVSIWQAGCTSMVETFSAWSRCRYEISLLHVSAVRKGKFTLSARPNVRVCSLADLGSAGGRPHPLGVLQKNSGSTNFENSEDSRQHDYHYYQFLPRILRVGGREGMKGLGALQRNQLPHPPCKNPGSATKCAAEVVNEQRTGAYHRGKNARHYRAECERPLITRRLAMINY